MSKHFPAEPVLEPLPDGKRWRIVEDFHFHGKGGTITVPAGFLCDFASTPRWIWWLLPPWGRYGRAAIIHDRLYSTGEVTKEAADAIFLDGMRACGVGRMRSRVMWLAVALFGKKAWDGHRHGHKVPIREKDGVY